jgi:hypothetical protein
MHLLDEQVGEFAEALRCPVGNDDNLAETRNEGPAG